MNSRRDMRTAEKGDPQTFLLLGVLGILDNEVGFNLSRLIFLVPSHRIKLPLCRCSF